MSNPPDKAQQPIRILAVEDEESIRELLIFALERKGHTVVAVETVSEARVFLADNHIDIALIDWMLPDISGLDFVRSLRKNELTRDLPIIMLTARGEEVDISTGLDAGADDYVTKPFSPKELHSRINAILRRSQAHAMKNAELTVGGLTLNTATHAVFSAETEIDAETEIELGHTEFKLLSFLMRNPERVFSRTQLLDHVWGTGTFIEERTVDVHILRLRKSLKPTKCDSLLETIRGAGYRLSSKVRTG